MSAPTASEYLQMCKDFQALESASVTAPPAKVDIAPAAVAVEMPQEIMGTAAVEDVQAALVPAPEPVAEDSSDEPEAEETDIDKEIKETALRFINQTDSVKKTAELLLAEFDGVTSDEAQAFAIEAVEESRNQTAVYAEQLTQQAMKANDTAQAAQAENNRLFLENYGYKHRKRIKVSPEDEEKAAKLYRELAEKEQGPKTRVRRMDFTKKKKLYWLWQNRIPFGALTTIAGDPDEGKSLITLYLSACVSTGKKLYGNTEKTEP